MKLTKGGLYCLIHKGAFWFGRYLGKTEQGPAFDKCDYRHGRDVIDGYFACEAKVGDLIEIPKERIEEVGGVEAFGTLLPE
jgi:hypothetical protein